MWMQLTHAFSNAYEIQIGRNRVWVRRSRTSIVMISDWRSLLVNASSFRSHGGICVCVGTARADSRGTGVGIAPRPQALCQLPLWFCVCNRAVFCGGAVAAKSLLVPFLRRRAVTKEPCTTPLSEHVKLAQSNFGIAQSQHS